MGAIPNPNQVTQLLQQVDAGNALVAEELLPLVYDELRGLAANFLGSSRQRHTIQPTALVHEAYLKLVNVSDPNWSGRQHFFRVAAKAMRQVLVNYARDKKAEKRGGSSARLVTLDSGNDVAQRSSPPPAVDVLALEEALSGLEESYPQQCRIVELKFFAGLTNEEAAEILGVTTRTVEREWRMAKAELLLRLGEVGGAG